ncbi:MAG: PIG-L family deacetylase [Myxococcota bacterium]
MRKRVAATVFLTACLLGCPHAAPAPRDETVDLVVIAPHPDDEVLMAGGVLEQAVKAGRRAAVIVLTNGDLGCFDDRDGALRQAETVSALAALGLDEDAVHFLGYPDGHLARLGATPLREVDWRAPDGTCATRRTTLATRGAGHLDEHTRRTGRPAPFTAPALTGDLAALLERLAPRDVYLPHGLDEHPDHAATYLFFRRALARLVRGPVTVHRAVVHAGPCWPTDCATSLAPDEPLPELPAPFDGYRPTERVPIEGRRKLALIAHYASQAPGGAERDWLAGFARRDEAFFTETLRRDASGRWTTVEAERTGELPIAEGATVSLESGATLAVAVTDSSVTLHADGRVVARWERIGAQPPFSLRVTTRRDANGYAEWSLWGAGEFAGTRVLRGFPRGG